jgi:chromosomal replication initiator protein
VDAAVDSIHDPSSLASEPWWDKTISSLRGELNEATWVTWFAAVQPVELTGTDLTVSVPSTLVRDRIQSNYAGMLKDAVRVVTGLAVELHIVVRTEPRKEQVLDVTDDAVASGRVEAPPGKPSKGSQKSARPPAPARESEDPLLHPKYTFENFVIGTSNRFAHAAALASAEKPGHSFNPLFIYGGSGLGKTHLLHAIGHFVQQVYPEKTVHYVPTETFMNDFVDALRTNTASVFKRRYRNVDVLLIDDIQFMENKEGLQEEFFHTFNELHTSDRQVVITSDRPPKAIATLEDRLRSRFEWGLSIDIQPPDLETRLAILQKRAEAEGYSHVPDDVLGFIATNIRDNVRELEGALIRVAAYARLNQSSLSETLAREILADMLPGAEARVITPAVILDETSKMFGWSIDELCGKSRRRPLVIARQIAMYVFRELTDYSYPQIAREFGGRDHTTVMHAVEKITAQMAERRAIYDQVTELTNRLKHGER